MNRWYSDYFLVRRALFLSTANANVVRTVCSVLKGLHNPSKEKSCFFSPSPEGFLPKGSEKKSRKNGKWISCCYENQAPKKPQHLILLSRACLTLKNHPDIQSQIYVANFRKSLPEPSSKKHKFSLNISLHWWLMWKVLVIFLAYF